MSDNHRSDRMNGIDFHQALEILSARAAASSSSSLPSNDEENRSHAAPKATTTMTTSSSCPCCNQPSLPDSVKELGQVLDLFSSSENDDQSSSSSLPSPDDMQAQKQELDATRRQRQDDLHESLRSMSVPDLLRAVLSAQQQRVAAYKSYDRGLETVLHTRNLALYPAVVAEATASFAVLSDTINAIQKQLSASSDAGGDDDDEEDPSPAVRRGRDDLAAILRRLQLAEQQKLSLTAALHLEQIRLQSVDNDAASIAGAAKTDAAQQTRRLLEGGVQSLQSKVSVCVESINDVMDDLQCAIVEESERYMCD